MTERVKEILSWYDGENIGVRTNLARILNHGTLAGSGRAVILPVDQGFEHGPARSFAPNPDGGGFGSIVGRNSFQRPEAEAIALLRSMMEIYAA